MKTFAGLRKLWNLVLIQALYQTCTVLIMKVGGNAGKAVSEDPAWATIPLAASVAGTLVMLIPASFALKSWGSRKAYSIAILLGLASALVMGLAMGQKSFVLLTAGMFIFGLHQSILQYLRFTAMEMVSADDKPTALSVILLAGIPAALLGPYLGQLGVDLTAESPYMGSFLLMAAVIALEYAFSFTLRPPAAAEVPGKEEPKGRPLREFTGSLPLWTAILASSMGFAIMVMVMAASPMAMKTHHHAEWESTLVLQAHVLAMYIPSFFSGLLVKRWGPRNMILAGVLLMGAEVAVTQLGLELWPFLFSLILLGVGWNFMFVGGNSLLVTLYSPSEKAYVQAFHDFFVFGLGSLGVSLSAFLEVRLGWQVLNLVVVPALLLVGLFALIGRKPKVLPNTASSASTPAE